MSTLQASAPAVEIVIKDALYYVEPIPAGEFGLAAVRLTKRSREGETYDVIRTHEGVIECDCPSYEFTFRGTAGTCKHGAACLAKGLLVAPISGGSPVADAPPAVVAPAPAPAVVRPVTEADLKRARYFHLAIPKPAPAPIAEAAPEIPAENPRDSWPAWTDELAYTVADGPPALASDEESAGTIDLTPFASRMAAVGEDAPSPVYTMPRLGGPVVLQPELVGLPPALPPMAWVEVGPRAYQMANLTPDRTDYPRPARRYTFAPTAEEQVEAAVLLADRRGSCLAGESSPPVGDRGVPRRATAWPRRTFDEPREHDGYAPGYYS